MLTESEKVVERLNESFGNIRDFVGSLSEFSDALQAQTDMLKENNNLILEQKRNIRSVHVRREEKGMPKPPPAVEVTVGDEAGTEKRRSFWEWLTGKDKEEA